MLCFAWCQVSEVCSARQTTREWPNYVSPPQKSRCKERLTAWEQLHLGAQIYIHLLLWPVGLEMGRTRWKIETFFNLLNLNTNVPSAVLHTYSASASLLVFSPPPLVNRSLSCAFVAHVNTKLFCSLWEGVKVGWGGGGGGRFVSLYVVKDLFMASHAAVFTLPVLSGRSFNTLWLAGR